MSNSVKVIVRRSEWYRGRGVENSKLICSDGLKCCLGFAGLACGIPAERLFGVADPASISDISTLDAFDNGPFSSLLREYSFNTEICEDLMDINDNRDLDETEREQQLTELGAEIGLLFEFVD